MCPIEFGWRCSERAGIVAAVVAATLITGSEALAGQSTAPEGAPAFAVASVKPAKCAPSGVARVQARAGGVVVAVAVPLRRMVAFAYGLKSWETPEGKSDVLDRCFDVDGRAAVDATIAGLGEVGPLNVMMQTLLADRFKMVVRWEDRVRRGYALVRLRSDEILGPRLLPSGPKCQAPATDQQTPQPADLCNVSIVNGELKAEQQPIARIAATLALLLGEPIVDRTQLRGNFDARMTFTLSEFLVRPGGPSLAALGSSNAPSLFTAIREQLGLKLQRQRVVMSTLVVDRAEEPAPN
jgi:uncharacterized protein (TIGR03435 family)